MALIKCYECKKEISDKAEACPHCGAPNLYEAAEQGDAEAQNALGSCYYLGTGVEQDYAKAVYWFEKAAEQGIAKAQNKLGGFYIKGDGVEQDSAKAVYWLKKTADQGYTNAKEILKELGY